MSDSLERLQTAGAPQDEEDVEPFESLVFEVAQDGDPAAISVLLGMLDDDSPFTGTMETILQHAALLPGYLNVLVEQLPKVAERSPGWARNEVRKWLNTPGRVDDFKQAGRSASLDARLSLIQVLGDIAGRPGKLGPAAEAFAAELSRQN